VEILLCSGYPTQLLISAALIGLGLDPSPGGRLSGQFVFALATIDTVLLLSIVMACLLRRGESPRRVFFGSAPVGQEAIAGVLAAPLAIALVVALTLIIRLIAPGWYGVANVKWLSEIRLQENRFLGNYQARWYRTVRAVGGSGELTDPETQFIENEVTKLNLKSVIARVRRSASGAHTVLGFVLNDGTPLKSVEVKVDDGPWQRATLDPANTQYSWKLFTYRWDGATPGEHTLVSRVTQADGLVQPTEQELANKKTFLEDNSQHPRKIMIS